MDATRDTDPLETAEWRESLDAVAGQALVYRRHRRPSRAGDHRLDPGLAGEQQLAADQGHGRGRCDHGHSLHRSQLHGRVDRL